MIPERRLGLRIILARLTKHRRPLPMDTVLFTDFDVLTLTTVASAIVLGLAVLLVSTRVEKGVDRVESKIRQVLIHQ